jgi:MbtH protein
MPHLYQAGRRQRPVTAAARRTSMNGDEEDFVEYAVVVNAEEQYSIWPTELADPAGWERTGVVGPKAECLAEVERVWTDMRPASLRRWMDAQASSSAPSDTLNPS